MRGKKSVFVYLLIIEYLLCGLLPHTSAAAYSGAFYCNGKNIKKYQAQNEVVITANMGKKGAKQEKEMLCMAYRDKKPVFLSKLSFNSKVLYFNNVKFKTNGIKQLVLTKSIKNIDSVLESGCAIEKVIVPKENKYFSTDGKALYNKKKTKLYRIFSTVEKYTIPDSVTTLSKFAIGQKRDNKIKLKELTIGKNVRDIKILRSDYGIQSISVKEENRYFSSHSGILYKRENGREVWYYCPGDLKKEEITIPAFGTAVPPSDANGWSASLSSIQVEEGGPEYFSKNGVLYQYKEDGAALLCAYPGQRDTHILELPDTVVSLPDWFTGLPVEQLYAGRKFDFKKINESNIQYIDIPEDNKNYSSDNGLVFNKKMTELCCFPAGSKTRKISLPKQLTDISQTVLESMRKNNYLSEIDVDKGNASYSSDNGMLCNKDKTEILVIPRAIHTRELVIPDSVQKVDVLPWSESEYYFGYGDSKDLAQNQSYLLWDNDSIKTIKIGENARQCPITAGVEKIIVSEKNPYFTVQDDVLYNKDKTKLCYYPLTKQEKEFCIPDTVEDISASYLDRNPYLECVEFGKSVKKTGDTGKKIPVFRFCRNLQEFKVVKENQYFAAQDGILYNKKKTELLAVPFCCKAETVTIPDSIKNIEGEILGEQNDGKTKTIHFGKNFKNILGKKIKKENGARSTTDFLFRWNRLEKFQVSGKNPYYLSKNGVLYSKNGKKLIAYPPKKKDKVLKISSKVNEIVRPYALSIVSALERFEVDKKNSSFTVYSGALYNKKITEFIAYPPGRRNWSITIPKSVKRGINGLNYYYYRTGGREYAYQGNYCRNTFGLEKAVYLKNIKVSTANSYFTSEKGLLFTKDKTKLCAVPGKASTLWIPSKMQDMEYNKGENFLPAAIKEIRTASANPCFTTVEDALLSKDKKIMYYLAQGSHTESYTLPEEVEKIAAYAMADNKSLAFVELPENLKQIGAYAFYNNLNMETIYIPEQVDRIEQEAFSGTFLKQITFTARTNVMYNAIPAWCRIIYS